MKCSARAPGTCGEFVQGMKNGVHFLVTCPINCYSNVSIELNNRKNFFINDINKKKVLLAVEKTMKFITGEKQGANIFVQSSLPLGKGMASSTADISAACVATASALKYKLVEKEIAKLALSIEPSDGVFFPAIAAFDHVNGTFNEKIGQAINMDIMIFDFGGEIDTILFNKRDDLIIKNHLKEDEVSKALHLVRKGFKTENPQLIAQGSTLSAIANQNIIYKPNLEKIIEFCVKKGAWGINTAHSGTSLGILFNKKIIECHELRDNIIAKFPFLKYIGVYKLINGGVNSMIEEEATFVSTNS